MTVWDDDYLVVTTPRRGIFESKRRHIARTKLAAAATIIAKLQHEQPVSDQELLDFLGNVDDVVRDYPKIAHLISRFKAFITEEAQKRNLL